MSRGYFQRWRPHGGSLVSVSSLIWKIVVGFLFKISCCWMKYVLKSEKLKFSHCYFVSKFTCCYKLIVIYKMLMYLFIYILKSHFCIILVYFLRKVTQLYYVEYSAKRRARMITRNFAMWNKNFARVRTQPWSWKRSLDWYRLTYTIFAFLSSWECLLLSGFVDGIFVAGVRTRVAHLQV